MEAGRINHIQTAGAQEVAGEVRAGLVLAKRPHVGEEDHRPGTLFLHPGVSLGEQGFKTFRQAALRQGFHFQRFAALAVNPGHQGLVDETGGKAFSGGLAGGVHAHFHFRELDIRILAAAVPLVGGAAGAFRRLQFLLCQVDILVDAHDGLPALVRQFVTFGGGGVHLLLDAAGFESLDDAAFLFDALEEFPYLPGGFIRQVFQVPGTAGGVNDLVQIAFAQQNQRAVAGNAAGEFVRHAHGSVKGQNVNTVHAAHDGGECLGGAAQQVDPGIHLGEGPEGGAGMEPDFGSFLASSAFFDDDGPEFAQGADFGDFQEQVGADGDRKAHVRRSFIHGEAAFLHGAQIGHGSGQHGAHFFKSGSAGIRVRQPADADGLEAGSVGDGPFGHYGHLVIVGADAFSPAKGTLHHSFPHRVI